MSAEVASPPAVKVTDTDPNTSEDPFAAQRGEGNNPFTEEQKAAGAAGEDTPQPKGGALATDEDKAARRTSKEWDASKVKPSQFQKRKGSVYATPSSRDGHAHDKDRDARYHQKIKETAKSKGGIFGFFKKAEKKTPKEDAQ